MKEPDFISLEQMKSILDNSPTAIYINEIDTFELLYANRLAKSILLQHPDTEGLTCYQAAGFDRPCSFCRTKELSYDKFLVREFYHEPTGYTYQLSGKLIEWNGKQAHIEYIQDITEKKRDEERRRKMENELKTTFSSIPCGLCVYLAEDDKISPIIHNPAFYEVMGYSQEHINSVERETDFLGVHPDDLASLTEKISKIVVYGGIMRHTYRFWNDRREEYRVIQLDGTAITDENGRRLLYAVYSDISEQKNMELELSGANEKLDHLLNSIPGGIASFKVVGDRFIPTFYSDGIPKLSGHSREEYEKIVCDDALNTLYAPDKERVIKQSQNAIKNDTVLEISYRLCHKDGSLVWVHLNGKRMKTAVENDIQVYVVITGMSAETRLFQEISNDTADGIYIISKENYELLYANESKKLFKDVSLAVGQKCYTALFGKDAPCEFCTLNTKIPYGEEHKMLIDQPNCFYTTSFRETDWNGVPAYVKLVRDVTEEVSTRREKEQLEMYYQTLVKNLPGGVLVIRCEPDGGITPEFVSEGFTAMTHMNTEAAKLLYRTDFAAVLHPDDADVYREKLQEFMENGEDNLELIYRMKLIKGDYIWIKNSISRLQMSDGICRLYMMFTDITKTAEEKERLSRRYEELIIKHYQTPGDATLLLGHCNISKNEILEIWDATGIDPLKIYGKVREDFFLGLSELIVDNEERQTFINNYLNSPALASYQKNEFVKKLTCFIKLPHEEKGRYAEFQMNMVKAPETDNIIGILTVTDVTKQTLKEHIMHQLSVASYDLAVDVDLIEDQYVVLKSDPKSEAVTNQCGSYSAHIANVIEKQILLKDRARVAKMIDTKYMLERLKNKGTYSISFSMVGENGEALAKRLTVSEIDLRLGRVCLAQTDITASIREQQGLLNMMAYSFELMAFFDISSKKITIYTRQIVLGNMPPIQIDDTEMNVNNVIERFGFPDSHEKYLKQFSKEVMLECLEKEPNGYDFVAPYQENGEMHYKQINVMWGDENHKTICIVCADITDIMAAERKSKKALEDALVAAEDANRAKSDFLSSMSHDIRTPMNAIMGMTTLALAKIDDKSRVEECLKNISLSNKHLLSLVNDVLDMSWIEHGKINMSQMEVFLPEQLEHIYAIVKPQTKSAGLMFSTQRHNICHEWFCGDPLRVNQILINILSNAVKFTPEGGRVEFNTEEITPKKSGDYVRYRFTISDTGVGMSKEFLNHIFEPFVRNLNTKSVEGTGLGLSITKGLVDLMGGEISVKSEETKGSVFQVELEFKISEKKDDAVTSSESTDDFGNNIFEGRTFLIVEDNAINAEILCELLSMFGAKTVVKTDGKQAVQAFLDSAPGMYDAILMDIQMPVMNGYEATRMIREQEREDAKTIPIIAMTANAFAEDVQASKVAGMNAHVAKPIEVDRLKAVLYGELN